MPDLWPWPALIGATEELGWLTDIRQTPQAEARDALRQVRQSLNYSFLMDDPTRARALQRLRDNPLGDWLVPVWFDRTLLSTTVAATDTVLAVDTAADYRVGGLAVAILSEETYAIVEIAEVGAGLLTLSAPVGATLAGTPLDPVAICPLRRCFLRGGLKESRRHKGLTEFSAEFVVRDTAETAASPFPIHAAHEVMTDAPLAVAPLSGALAQEVEEIDNEMGPIVLEPARDIVSGRMSLAWLDQGAAARWRRRCWLHHLRGRDRAFWLPSFAADLALTAPIAAGDRTIDVAASFPAAADHVGRHLMIDDGTRQVFREVTAATRLLDIDRLTVTGHAAIYLALDCSASMSGTPGENQRTGAQDFLEALKTVPGGLSIKIVFHGGDILGSIERFDVTAADLDDLKAWVAGQTDTVVFEDFDAAIAPAKSFFDSAAAEDPTLSKLLVFLADGGATPAETLDAAVARIAAELTDVELHAIAISPAEPGTVAPLDSTPADGVPVIDATSAASFTAELIRAVAMPADMAASAEVSLMTLVRLDADRIEIGHEGAGIARVSTVALEVPA